MEPDSRYARMIQYRFLLCDIMSVVKVLYIDRLGFKDGWERSNIMLRAEKGDFAAKILFLIMILPERLLRSEKMVRYQ